MRETTENSIKKEPVRLDETVKLLFELSKSTLVKTLNALFNENYEADKVKIDMTSTEYHKNNLDMLRADICIKITEYKPHHYHAEIQTEPHKEMALRMFEYDIMESLRNYRLENTSTPDTIDLFMPKSIVIQIEDGKSVPKDYYALNLRLANGEIARYTAPVLRYFEYDTDRLINEGLLNLLPLQIFKLRAELDRMTKDGNEAGRQTAILKAKDITDKIANIVVNLYKEEKFNDIDVDKIMIAISECFEHLNNRYEVNEKLNEEVSVMVRTFLDKTLIEQRDKAEKARENDRIEIAINLLDVLDIETIAEKTKLSIEKVKELKEEYSNKTDENK